MSAVGMPGPNQVPTYDQLAAYNVNRDGWEAIKQSLYDSQAILAAGSVQLNFFQLPVGQGTGFGGAALARASIFMPASRRVPVSSAAERTDHRRA